MKKFTLFSAITILSSAFIIGCNADGTNSFCRTGSLFPIVKDNTNNREIYIRKPVGNNCDPCEPIQPQPCNPCEPVCNPCDNTSCTGTILPGKVGSPIGG